MERNDRLIRLFGQTMLELRVKAGLSQDDVAEAAGLSPDYVGRIERGRQEPSLSAIVLIARALDVTPNRLLGIGTSTGGSIPPKARHLIDCFCRLATGDQNALLVIAERLPPAREPDSHQK